MDQMSKITTQETHTYRLTNNCCFDTHRTRPTRSRRSHFPKVVLGVKGEHAFGGQIAQPQLARLVVAGRDLVPTKVGGVEPFRIEFELLREAFPGHVNGSLFKVVSKGPVSEHFEKGVVVHVLAHVVQIVVFASRANALLAVDRALQMAHFQVGVAGSCM